MKTEFLLLALYNKPNLTFEGACKCLNLEIGSSYVKRATGR